MLSPKSPITPTGCQPAASFLALQQYEENARADIALLFTASRATSKKAAARAQPTQLVRCGAINAGNELAKLFHALPAEQQDELLAELADVDITAATFWADAASQGTLHQLPFRRLAYYRYWFLRQGYADVFDFALAELKFSWP